MQRLIVAILIGFSLFASAGCSTLQKDKVKAPTTPVLERIQKSGVLRVGLSGNQPPFNMKTRAGKIIGIEPDLANALAETIGARAEFVVRPFGELLAALEAGEVDIVMGEADEVEPPLDARVLDDEELRRKQMLSQLNELVVREPSEAAILVKQWIRQTA